MNTQTYPSDKINIISSTNNGSKLVTREVVKYKGYPRSVASCDDSETYVDTITSPAALAGSVDSPRIIEVPSYSCFRDLAKIAITKEKVRLENVNCIFKWTEERPTNPPRVITAWDIVVTNTSKLDVVVHETLNGSNVNKLKRVAACSSERFYGRGLVSMIAGQPVVIRIQDSDMIYFYITSDFNHDHMITNDYVCEMILTIMGNSFSYKSAKDVDDYFDRVEVEQSKHVIPYMFYRPD